MDNMIYDLFISLFVPILSMVILVDKKSRLPIIFVLVGMFMSLFVSEINGFLRTVLSYDVLRITVIVTPITEEIVKALPILFFALVISDKREYLFTASMATGIGFAILENAFYLLKWGTEFSVMDAVIRAFGAGLMHGMCTLLVGVGISFIKRRKKLFGVGTFALLSTAIIYHAIYNMLVQSEYSAIGALLPIITYIPFVIWRMRNKDKIQKVKS